MTSHHARYFMAKSTRVLAGLAVAFALITQPAMAQHADRLQHDEVLEALYGWIAAVASGDPDRIDAVLAPEFQIQRANGDGFDRESYLASSLPQITDLPVIEQLVVTVHDDLAVSRYLLNVDETIDGAPVRPQAPRLTVLRRDGEQWLVVAHANFSNPN